MTTYPDVSRIAALMVAQRLLVANLPKQEGSLQLRGSLATEQVAVDPVQEVTGLPPSVEIPRGMLPTATAADRQLATTTNTATCIRRRRAGDNEKQS